MNKHTAGPWQVETEKVKKRDWVMVVGKTGVVCRTGATDMPGALEDARLIAAAPDLLAACEMALTRIESDISETCVEVAVLRLALARARGEG